MKCPQNFCLNLLLSQAKNDFNLFGKRATNFRIFPNFKGGYNPIIQGKMFFFLVEWRIFLLKTKSNFFWKLIKQKEFGYFFLFCWEPFRKHLCRKNMTIKNFVSSCKERFLGGVWCFITPQVLIYLLLFFLTENLNLWREKSKEKVNCCLYLVKGHFFSRTCVAFLTKQLPPFFG